MAKRKGKRKAQGHPAKARKPEPDVQVPPHPFIEGATPEGEPLERMKLHQRREKVPEGHTLMPLDRGAMDAAQRGVQSLDGLPEEKIEQYRRQGLVREVDTAVGGEGEAAKLAGMMTDPKTGLIMGTVPGTPAAALPREELERLSGFKWGDDSTKITPLQLTQSLFPTAPASLGDLPPEQAAEVWSKLVGYVQDAAKDLVASGLISENEDGTYELADNEDAEFVAHRMDKMMEEARTDIQERLNLPRVTRAQENEYLRLDHTLHNHPHALKLIRDLSPLAGMDDDGIITGLENAKPEKWSAIKAELRKRAAAGDDIAKRLMRALKLDMGQLSMTEQGREWHATTLGGIKRATAKAQQAGSPVLPTDHELDPDRDSPRMHKSAALRKLLHDHWPEGEEFGEDLYLEEPIPISYVGIANLVGSSRRAGFTATMGEADVRKLDPHAMHEVLMGFRCRTPEHGSFVRVVMNTFTRTPGTNALILHDVPGQTWEALTGNAPELPVSAQVELLGLEAGMPAEYRLGSGDRPVWAGARAFNAVWDRAAAWAELADDSVDRGVDVRELVKPEHRDRYRDIRVLCGHSQQALATMAEASEVLADPDQVEAMPDFDDWDGMLRFAKDLHLPYEYIFLDMEGPAGSCVVEQFCENDGEKIPLVLRGALVERGHDGNLMITPFGHLATQDRVGTTMAYEPMGKIVFGRKRPPVAATSGTWAIQAVMETGFMYAGVCVDAGIVRRVLGDGQSSGKSSPKMTLPVSVPAVADAVCFLRDDADEGERDMRFIAAEAAELVAAGHTVLKALFLIDTPNVEIVQAPLERAARRHAERKGHTIALAVKVHTSSKRYVGRSNGDGPRREYSHRFRVRGHMNHYPVGTRMADAKPHEVKSCPRCGRCRRIWIPPFIKGPEDKPLILKSLVLDD